MKLNLWDKLIFPVRRLWLTVSSRLKPPNNGGGLLKLHSDVQTCGYEDVQVMWEMLRRTESGTIAKCPKRKQRLFWRAFLWSNHNKIPPLSANHAYQPTLQQHGRELEVQTSSVKYGLF